MSKLRVIATGLEFPEGPVVMPDGSVVLVEIRAQKLTRVYPDGRKETVAKIPGGPNGAAIGPDGKCYICNNGGFSWSQGRRCLDAWRAGAVRISRWFASAGRSRNRQDRDPVRTLR